MLITNMGVTFEKIMDYRDINEIKFKLELMCELVALLEPQDKVQNETSSYSLCGQKKMKTTRRKKNGRAPSKL